MRRGGSKGKLSRAGLSSDSSKNCLKKSKAEDFERKYSFLNNSVSGGIPDNTGGTANPPVSGFPDSNLGDYVFTIESSLGGAFANFNSFTDKSKIHVTNISDLDNIVHFTWTPPDSVEPDFYNGNEMLIWGNDIWILFKWSGLCANSFASKEYYERNNVSFPGYDNVTDSNGEFDLAGYSGYKYGFNKVLKLENCSIDEANEEILYDSYQTVTLDHFMSAHGNTVTDDYWILEERAYNYDASKNALIPLSGDISNYKLINPSRYGYEPSELSKKGSVSRPGGDRFLSYFNYPSSVFYRYGDQITSSDKYIYSIGKGVLTDDQEPPWYPSFSSYSYPLCLIRKRIDGSEGHIVHPFLNYSTNPGRHHPTSFGDYVITTYMSGYLIEMYKYNRKTASLEIKIIHSVQSGHVNGTDIADAYDINTGEASITVENIYDDLVADGQTIDTNPSIYGTDDYPDGNIVNLGYQHANYTDGTYIWMVTRRKGGLYRFSFDTLEYDESARVSYDGFTDDLCIAGDYVFLAGEGNTKNLVYINKEDFGDGFTTVADASFTYDPYGVFYKEFIY